MRGYKYLLLIVLAVLVLGTLRSFAEPIYLLTVEDFSGVVEGTNETSAWVYSADKRALRTATSKGETATASFRAEPGTYHLWVYHTAGMGWGDGSRRTQIEVRIQDQRTTFGAEPNTSHWTKVGVFQLEEENRLELAGFNEQNSAFIYGLLFTTDPDFVPMVRGPEGIAFIKEILDEGGLETVAAVPSAEGLIIGGFHSKAQARFWGLEPVEEPTKNGLYAGEWEHTVGSIRLASGFPGPIPQDWTPYAYLEFDCYSPAKTDAWWKLNIMSDNPETDGGDYYTVEFLVDWEGWKHFKLRLADLVVSRNPIGWHQIDGIELWNHGWGHTQDPDTVIYFNNIRLVEKQSTAAIQGGPGQREEDGALILVDFTDPAAIESLGLRAVDFPLLFTDYSGRWADHHLRNRIWTSNVPQDWSQFTHLELWIYSEVANGAWFQLNVLSQNPTTEGGDYYYRSFTVDWEGWRKFTLPFSSFGVSREPLGWDQVDGFEFYASGWGHEADPTTVLYFGDMRLIRLEEALTQQSLFLQREQLARLEGVISTMDDELTIDLPVPHPYLFIQSSELDELRQRLSSNYLNRQLLNRIAADARKALTVPIPTVKERLEDLEPWEIDGRVVTRLMGDNVEQFALAMAAVARANRVRSQVIQLAGAYLLTGQEELGMRAKEWLMAATTWGRWTVPGWTLISPTSQLPPGGDDGEWFGTSSMLVAMALGYDWLQDLLTAEEKEAIKEAVYWHCQKIISDFVNKVPWYVRSNAAYSNQWTIVYSALGLAGVAFYHDFPEAREWIILARNNTIQSLDEQCPSGGFTEGVGYAVHTIRDILPFAEALADAGDLRIVEHPFWRNAGYYFIHLTSPDRKYNLNINDCAATVVQGTDIRYYISAAAKRYQDPVYQWYLTELGGPPLDIWYFLWYDPTLEAKSPAGLLATSQLFAGIGVVTMRTSWEKDAALFSFNSQPYVPAHDHPDRNGINLWVGEDKLLAESGISSYGNPLHATYYQTTAAHNTILVNGMGQEKPYKGEILGYFGSDTFNYVSGEGGYSYADLDSFQRHNVFIKEDYLLVYDRLRSSGLPVTFEWVLHTEGDLIPHSQNSYRLEGSKHHALVEFLDSRVPQFRLEEGYLATTAQPHPYLVASWDEPAVEDQFLVLVQFGPKEQALDLQAQIGQDDDQALYLDIVSPDWQDQIAFNKKSSTNPLTLGDLAVTGQVAYVRWAEDTWNRIGLFNGNQVTFEGQVQLSSDQSMAASLTKESDGLCLEVAVVEEFTKVAVRTAARPRKVLLNGRDVWVLYRQVGANEMLEFNLPAGQHKIEIGY